MNKPGDKRRHPRYRLEGRVRARVGGEEHEGRLKNVSGGGALIDMPEPLENDLFVELHLEGLGRLPGRVVRGRENEIAVKFTVDEDEEKRIAMKLERVNFKS
ncbi:MAG: PilZ domain-containing protein [Rhodospirillales bacterium]|jgi:hypothetical protein|nr:PilZ domain-containing protein [Rhodospirillales bacterium]MDP6882875.1 PilZ domain-containing protein [Rhodospirillales bacterium]